MFSCFEILFTIHITIIGFLIITSLLFHVKQKWSRDAMMQNGMQKVEKFFIFPGTKSGAVTTTN